MPKRPRKTTWLVIPIGLIGLWLAAGWAQMTDFSGPDGGDLPGISTPGPQGCAPSFWKRSDNLIHWNYYDPHADFGSTFGVDVPYDTDLMDALYMGGGIERDLRREAARGRGNPACRSGRRLRRQREPPGRDGPRRTADGPNSSPG